MAYEYFKDLTRGIASDKILRGKPFNIAKNAKYDGYDRGLLQWFINSLIKRILVVQLKTKLCLIQN